MWHTLAVEARPVGQILAHQDQAYYFLTESCSRNLPVFLVTSVLEKEIIYVLVTAGIFLKHPMLKSPLSLSSV